MYWTFFVCFVHTNSLSLSCVTIFFRLFHVCPTFFATLEVKKPVDIIPAEIFRLSCCGVTITFRMCISRSQQPSSLDLETGEIQKLFSFEGNINKHTQYYVFDVTSTFKYIRVPCRVSKP